MFLVAFGAATLLPMPSEPLFAALQIQGQVSLIWLVALASLGNTLGSVINYGLGWHVTRFEGRRWFPASPARLARARRWFDRWGVWALLLSWLPMGDAVTLCSGVMRTRFWIFLVLVATGKTLRYVALALITSGILAW
jgi:membrane protein YqaA with SNARE-associated domain